MTQSIFPDCFVFNGDADGLISQHLMELSGISPSMRVTGLKREIVLLEQLPYLETANIHVFDISLETNRAGLIRLLKNPRINVIWFDHHEAGEIPASPNLRTRILNIPGTCTALLVHATLPDSDPRWAAMASFGDNIPEAGEALVRPLKMKGFEISLLREAGVLLNYNAYGESEADVLFQPLEVAGRLSAFRDPLEFVRESGLFESLRQQFREDESRALEIVPDEQRNRARIYQLPPEPWVRRFGATFVNRLARENPALALAVLHPLKDGSYQVSIRAPRTRETAVPLASDLAREFPTGGGRALAAGINRLAPNAVPEFNRKFFDRYSSF